VFERRLSQEEIDDAKRGLSELFSHTLHALNDEEENA
jgi:exonuclease SbcD